MDLEEGRQGPNLPPLKLFMYIIYIFKLINIKLILCVVIIILVKINQYKIV